MIEIDPPLNQIVMLDIDSLWTPSFQRPLSESWIVSTVDRFDPEAIGILTVADSSGWDQNDPLAGSESGIDGRYAILDGQGRWEVCRQVGLSEVRCEIKSVSRQRAAEITSAINKGRRDVKPFYRLRMAWAAEDAPSLALRDRVEAVGYKLHADTDHIDVIGAITAIEDVFYGRRGIQLRLRQDVLSPTLKLIRAAVRGEQKSLDGDFIRAVAMIFSANEDAVLDLERLKDTLAARTPQNWLTEGPGHRREDQLGRARGVALAIKNAYNAGKLAGAKYKPARGAKVIGIHLPKAA